MLKKVIVLTIAGSLLSLPVFAQEVAPPPRAVEVKPIAGPLADVINFIAAKALLGLDCRATPNACVYLAVSQPDGTYNLDIGNCVGEDLHYHDYTGLSQSDASAIVYELCSGIGTPVSGSDNLDR